MLVLNRLLDFYYNIVEKNTKLRKKSILQRGADYAYKSAPMDSGLSYQFLLLALHMTGPRRSKLSLGW